MNTSVDMNTILANCERTFANNERRYRSMAAGALEGIDNPSNALNRDAMRQDAARHEEQAERWAARRREAARGYFLARTKDLTDGEYMQEFSEVFANAQEAGRVVYEESPEGETIQRVEGEGGDSTPTSIIRPR